MSELITGSFYDIGGRPIYEDRVVVQRLTTPGGLSLTVAAVADGVGGENKGERAAQLAIDSLLSYFTYHAGETEVSTLLQTAVSAANQAVLNETNATQGATTTLAVAAVLNEKQLYIANVGDSKIYLCRGDKLTQLTIDHNFANVMPWQSEMSREAAAAHPRAEVLMRYLGRYANLQADVGFYVGTTDPQQANAQGCQGLTLKKGDAILLCSDGLTKEYAPQRPFTTPEEICNVLTSQEGDKAARSLVSFALGRNVNDNVSVAVLQMPDPQRRWRAKRPIVRTLLITILLFTIIGGFLFYMLRQTQEDKINTISSQLKNTIAVNETNAQATQTAVAAAAAISQQEGAAQVEAVRETAVYQENLFATKETDLIHTQQCLQPSSYSFTVQEPAQLAPAPIYRYRTNQPIPDGFIATITWDMTNTGNCPLAIKALIPTTNMNQQLPVALSQANEPVQAIGVGEIGQLTAAFPIRTLQELIALRDRYEAGQTAWILLITHEQTGEEILLFHQPQLAMQQTSYPKWFQIQNPPPTATPLPMTPTATPDLSAPTPAPLDPTPTPKS